jgi:hypothetical protein
MNAEIERRLASFVDRKAEMRRFCDMLEREDKLIMLISGESGLGKSLLFARMIQECEVRKRKRAVVEWTDTRPYDYLAVMRAIRNDFGPDLFKPFTDLINHFTDPHYTVKFSVEGSVKVAEGMEVKDSSVGDVGALIIKDSNIMIPRNDMAVPEAERLIQLTDRFLESFAAALAGEPLVVFFDAVEKMSEPTRKWVWGELLKAVLDGRLPKVRFVLCGISHPPLDLDMETIAEEAPLSPLGHADIVEYLALVGIEENLRPTIAKTLLATKQTKPYDVAAAAKAFKKLQEQTSGGT